MNDDNHSSVNSWLSTLSEKIYAGDDEVRSALCALDLELELFERVGQSGLAGRRRGTRAHPRPYAGYECYAESTATLRRSLHTKGWKIRDVRNSAWITHPSDGFSIVVATGNELTGDPESDGVSTAQSRGRVTAEAVRSNSLQFCFPQMQDYMVSLGDKPSELLWFLLQRVEDNRRLYMELSLPETIDSGGFPLTWRHRIILPVIDEGPRIDPDKVVPPSVPTIDFDVDLIAASE